MIFVTIGTQAPFDRFIEIIDRLAPYINEPIVAQVFQSKHIPKNIKTVDFLSPDEFNELFSQATLIISHAGMGTIISALTQSKPIIVFPRLASYKEHRNDHQLATARKMSELGYVHVAYSEEELREILQKEELKSLYELKGESSQKLGNAILEYISGL